jgi:nitrate/TMAO reductase-like tetraheme cytochrome c subunit
MAAVRVLAVLAVLLAVALALDSGSDDPHGFMDDEARCAECHQVEKDGDDWLLDAHIFTVSVTESCHECHPPQQIGRSHPVGADPRQALHMRDYPGELLPLHWSGHEGTEIMTCGTCHNPHAERFSDQKLYSRQRPYAGRKGEYLTYFLRIRGATPREGFTPLCNACHPDL